MFAPRIPKPTSTKGQARTVERGDAVSSWFYPSAFGNRHASEPLTRREEVTGINSACKSGQNSDLLNTMVRAPSWDFSKIPTYASGEGTHVPMPGPFTIRRLQRPPQTKLKIGDVSDPLEREADRVGRCY